jgi:hypothetical protein
METEIIDTGENGFWRNLVTLALNCVERTGTISEAREDLSIEIVYKPHRYLEFSDEYFREIDSCRNKSGLRRLELPEQPARNSRMNEITANLVSIRYLRVRNTPAS